MSVAGIQIRKCNAERKNVGGGKVSIDNNMTLQDVTEKSMVGKKQGGVAFSFNFLADYINEQKVSVASITMEADVFYVDEPGKAKEVVDIWKKNKTVDKAVLRDAMNLAMDRCNVAAILLSREMELPPPIPMPKIKE